VITHEHMKKMKNQAIVCNIGHFDNEIDVASLKQYTWDNIKPQVDHIIFPMASALSCWLKVVWLTWVAVPATLPM